MTKTQDELEAIIVEADRKVAELAVAERSHEAARVANKKEFLKLSAERTKLEVIKDDIDGKEDDLAKRALTADVVEENNVRISSMLNKRELEIVAMSKKSKALCRRQETAASKLLDETGKLNAEAAELKAKYEHKYNKLKAAIDG